MAADKHNFRYLLKPGTDFALVSRFRTWVIISTILCVLSIGALFVNKEVRGAHLNWTIDFKGGTEIIYAFKNAQDPTKHDKVSPGQIRAALESGGVGGFDVSDMSWTDDNDQRVEGIMVRTPRFGATTPEQQQQATESFAAAFADRSIETTSWSGDRLTVRTRKPISLAEAAGVFTKVGLEPKPWDEQAAAQYATPDKGTGEYTMTFSMYGLGRQYAGMIEKSIGGIQVEVVQISQVSAKAGAELRNDGIKSLFYAMLLIVLYLAVRFDIRYAPGAIVATLHDAIMVVGVFAVTWTEVSLTSVAALLTVIGYSVNDTVVIFDRIRENSEKLKDKRLERVVDISLNEVLVRSVLTSATMFAVTLMMNIFGTGLVSNFAFAMNIGVIAGTYSSLFLASPVFLWVSRRFYSGPAPARTRAAAAES